MLAVEATIEYHGRRREIIFARAPSLEIIATETHVPSSPAHYTHLSANPWGS